MAEKGVQRASGPSQGTSPLDQAVWPGKGSCHAGSGLGNAPSCKVGKVLVPVSYFCGSIPGHPNPSKDGLSGGLSNLI